MMVSEVVKAIQKSKTIAISFHVSPDGDSLGSSLALALALKKSNKDCYIACKDTIPEIYSYLPFNKIKMEDTIGTSTDCVIVLDCGDVKRICTDINIHSRNYTVLNLDHHISNEFYGDINLVDTSSAAVGEIIFEIIETLHIPLDEEISRCIYTSIVSDTGGFKYTNTTPKTHAIAAKLISYNIGFNDIHMTLFQSKSLNKVKLYGKVIENLYLLEKDKVCIMKLTKDMLNELNMENSDTSDIISLGTDISSVEVVALLKEADSKVKVSLRSKHIVDVRKIAETFGGGGHIRAAGLTIDCDIKSAEALIINAIKKELI